MSTEPRCDGFLGGRVKAWQPAGGYRAGVDAVLLAASVPGLPGETALELGAGAGVASLCLAARVPGVAVTAVERDPGYAGLARRNGAAHGDKLEVVEADLAALPEMVKARRFTHVLFNPPYFDRTRGPASPDAAREMAMGEETPMEIWVDVAARRLAPGGWLTVIHRAERMPELLAALVNRGGFGGPAVLPLVARAGRTASRVIVQARKGGRAEARLLAPMVLHEGPLHERDGEDYTAEVRAILREGAPLTRFL
ncbi:tRNA1(Val) (adenine(37)-N6)-methyltransferase [Vannielia litorea]|uniref:tRNA1(Val) (adenine(37)-N6)-methyltransferase n=1 Tax=Vannielia litorea TaxID=1217970 RepID=UPI0021BD7ABE|nr:methyltransferase [Vannielia litorea]